MARIGPSLARLLLACLAVALIGCGDQRATERGTLSPERRAELARRPAYQRLYAPIYPSDDTPRLMSLGDFDTPRSYLGESWRHQGIDIRHRRGARVIAVAPGEACVQQEQINGLTVYLYPRISVAAGADNELVFSLPEKRADGRRQVPRHRVRIAYAHLDSTADNFRTCRFVRMGEVLGRIGTSGIASDPHLHFDVVVRRPEDLPGEPLLGGAVNPFYLMRREAGQPIGTITCFEEGMAYRPNPGEPERALNIVWPTQDC